MVICSTLNVTGGGGGGIDVRVLVISQDYLNKPYTRTAGVTGSGTGTFQIKEGSTVVISGTMTNGWGMVDIDNITVGNHTYCAFPSSTSACATFTIPPTNNYGCSPNNQCLPGYGNLPAGCNNTCVTPTYKWKCTDPATNTCSSGTDITYTYPDEASCKAAASCQPTLYHLGCNSTTNKCEQKSGGGGNTDGCTTVGQACGGGGEEDPCLACDKTKEFCLFDQCIKKNDVYMTVGAVVLLMVLTK